MVRKKTLGVWAGTGTRTNEALLADVGGTVQMEKDGEVVGIVGGIEFGDIEQALATEAIVKVASEERRVSIDVELACLAIDSIALYVDRVCTYDG